MKFLKPFCPQCKEPVSAILETEPNEDVEPIIPDTRTASSARRGGQYEQF